MASSPTLGAPLLHGFSIHLGPFSGLGILPPWWSQGIHPSNMVSGFQRPYKAASPLPRGLCQIRSSVPSIPPLISQSGHMCQVSKGGETASSCLEWHQSVVYYLSGSGQRGPRQLLDLEKSEDAGHRTVTTHSVWQAQWHTQLAFACSSIHDPTSSLLGNSILGAILIPLQFSVHVGLGGVISPGACVLGLTSHPQCLEFAQVHMRGAQCERMEEKMLGAWPQDCFRMERWI